MMKQNKYVVVSGYTLLPSCKTIIATTEIKAYNKLHARIKWRKNHKNAHFIGVLKVLDNVAK